MQTASLSWRHTLVRSLLPAQLCLVVLQSYDSDALSKTMQAAVSEKLEQYIELLYSCKSKHCKQRCLLEGCFLLWQSYELI